MEELLIWLPQIFAYTTGLLIVFGIYVGVQLSTMVRRVRKTSVRGVRRSDIMWLTFIAVITTAMILALFVFTGLTSQIMDMILVLEFTYAAMLYCLSGCCSNQFRMLNVSSSIRQRKII